MMNETAPAVRVNGHLAEVRFGRFDLDAYRFFLRAKALPEKRVTYDWRSDCYTLTTPARFLPRLTGEAAPRSTLGGSLAPHLFDYQRFFCARALEARRFAAYWDTGLGKTALQLEFGRQVVDGTGGRFLHIAPLSIVPQTVKEAAKFYGDALRLRRIQTRAELEAWLAGDGEDLTAIVNVEKLDAGPLADLRNLAGISIDESSLLKTGGGKRKWMLIHGCRGIEYKLSSTATPAPNEAMEYASQASFLETLRTEGEVLWTFFSRQESGDWVIKPHARQAFYEFMSTWSAYLRNPASYGFADHLKDLQPLEWVTQEVAPTRAQMDLALPLFVKHGSGLYGDEGLGVTARQKLSQIARGFLYEGEGERRARPVESHKPAAVAEIVRAELAAGRQVLVWTTFDSEADVLMPLLPAGCAEVLDGRVKSLEERERIVERTERGDTPVLLSKPQTMGFGRNLQQFSSVVFNGFDDSMERMYQAVRRCHRYGQTRAVRAFVPYVPELEGIMWSNLQQKAARFEEEASAMERVYCDLIMPEVGAWTA